MDSKKEILTKWFKLLISFSLLFLFAFVIIPLISTLPGFDILTQSNEKYNIDAESLFYTETDEFSEASNFMNNSSK